MTQQLFTSAARLAGTVNGSTFRVPRRAKSVGFYLNVTACGTDVADTLDVKIQHSPDATNWDDLVHFTQVLGNDADDSYKEIALINMADPSEDELRVLNTSLAAGNVMQGPIYDYVRATSTIVDADADGGFTFSVDMAAFR
jgi:hypothetical protein